MSEHPDDRGEVLDTQVAELAEAALLGALLWDPHRLDDVAWLDPTDFVRPAHQAIYRTLTGLAHDRIPIDLLALPTVLARGDYHDLHVDRAGNGPLSAYALSQLLTMTPANPPATATATATATGQLPISGHSEHRRYAAIVLDDSIRRQVLAMGARLALIADPPEASTAEDLNRALDQVLTQTTTRLDELTRALTETGAATDMATPARWAPPATPRRQQPALIQAEAAHAEYTLLGACLTLPRHRELATSRLRAGDFTQPEVAATWVALDALVRQGGSVDFVLLAAQQQRHGPHPDYGPGIAPTELLPLTRLSDPAAGWHALALVTVSAITRATDTAHQALTDAATDRHRHPTQVLAAARTALQRLDTIRRRLDDHAGPAAVTPAPTPPPRPTAPTLARTTTRTRYPTPTPRLPTAPHQGLGRTR